MTTKKHDPTKHKLTMFFGAVAGLNAVVVANGHSLSDWCSVNKDNANAENTISGDGEVTIEQSVDHRGTATLKLMNNSSARLKIDQALNSLNVAGANIEKIVYTDLNTGYVKSIDDCFIEKDPETSGSDKNGEVTYTFKGSNYQSVNPGAQIILNILTMLPDLII